MAKANDDDQQIQVEWSEIPNDILFKIAQTLTLYSDYIRLRAVCLKWRTVLPSTPPHTLPCQPPWLILPPSTTPHWNNGNNTNFAIANAHHHRRRTFYNVSTSKLHTFHFLESTYYPRRILGSSHGYLIITSETPEIFCYNPITKAKVLLPPLSTLPGVVSFKFSDVGREYVMLDHATRQSYVLDLKQMRDDYIRKIVLSSPPNNNNNNNDPTTTTNLSPCFAFAITVSFLTQNTELVFCRVSQADHPVKNRHRAGPDPLVKDGPEFRATRGSGQYQPESGSSQAGLTGLACSPLDHCWVWVPVLDFAAEDVIYCQSEGLFYAVNHAGDVGCFRVDPNKGVCDDDDMSILQSVNVISGDLKYLVLLNGGLMLITRVLCAEADVITYCELNKTVGFEVYLFCESGPRQVEWVPVKELGDGVVVFVGESLSLALSASDFPGCKGNCIYFTDDHSKCNDVGVFDLKEKCVDALPCFPEDASSLPLSWESPIWITPNPC